jgi:hypothetical protein
MPFKFCISPLLDRIDVRPLRMNRQENSIFMVHKPKQLKLKSNLKTTLQLCLVLDGNIYAPLNLRRKDTVFTKISSLPVMLQFGQLHVC